MRICGWCGEDFTNIPGYRFGAHRRNCKLNPDRDAIIKIIANTRRISAIKRKEKTYIPKPCERCGKDHDGTFASGRFCSIHCANSKPMTTETKEKISNTLSLPKIIVACKWCNTKFSTLSKTNLYCSRSCFQRHRWTIPEYREKMMKVMRQFGGPRLRGGRSKFQDWYESPTAGRVFLQSTYELEYAKRLDSQGISWVRNKKKFPYVFEGKLKNYYPDFYLVDEDVYVEVKGYQTERDLAKWKHFPYKLKIITGKDLGLSNK